MAYSFKSYLTVSNGQEKEIRRFTLASDLASNYYTHLRDKIRAIYPLLRQKNFTVKYLDEENDEIFISSEEELHCALMSNKRNKQQMNGNTGTSDEPLRLLIQITEGPCDEPAASPLIPPPTFLPENCEKDNNVIICSSCCKGISEGFRYKCLQCPDYNHCGQCETIGAHGEHPLLRVNGPLITQNVKDHSHQESPCCQLLKVHLEQAKKTVRELQANGPEMLQGMGNKLLSALEQFGAEVQRFAAKQQSTANKNKSEENKDDASPSQDEGASVINPVRTPLLPSDELAKTSAEGSHEEIKEASTPYEALLDDIDFPSTTSTIDHQPSAASLGHQPQQHAEQPSMRPSSDGNMPQNIGACYTGLLPPSQNQQRNVNTKPLEPRLAWALQHMLGMGYTNEDGWLTDLLRANGGDIHMALEILHPSRT